MLKEIKFDGSVEISDFDIEDCLFHHRFFGYSMRSAEREFRRLLREHNAKLTENTFFNIPAEGAEEI